MVTCAFCGIIIIIHYVTYEITLYAAYVSMIVHRKLFVYQRYCLIKVLFT